MAIDYPALRTEVETDPKTLGYAPFLAAGNDQAIADAMNLLRATESVPQTTVPVSKVVGALVRSEYAGLTADDKQLFSVYLTREEIDISESNIVAGLLAMFPLASRPLTRANLLALANRTASRAEALFGPRVQVTASDIARAFGRG